MSSEDATQQNLDRMIPRDLQPLYPREVAIYKRAWREALEWQKKHDSKSTDRNREQDR